MSRTREAEIENTQRTQKPESRHREKHKGDPMKFPEMTVTTINLPTILLKEVDLYATKRILN
jgi:hypothetical protein